MVTEFIAHDSSLQLGSLNQVRAESINSELPCRQCPSKRTLNGHRRTGANDPFQKFGFEHTMAPLCSIADFPGPNVFPKDPDIEDDQRP